MDVREMCMKNAIVYRNCLVRHSVIDIMVNNILCSMSILSIFMLLIIVDIYAAVQLLNYRITYFIMLLVVLGIIISFLSNCIDAYEYFLRCLRVEKLCRKIIVFINN